MFNNLRSKYKRIKSFILCKSDTTSSNALEAKKGKGEGHAGSKST